MSEPARADSVGERLRNLRHGLGLSQEQPARRLGVSFVTANRWESGKTQISAKAAAAAPADLEADASVAVQITEPEEPADSHVGGDARQLTALPGPGSVWLQSVPSRSIPPSHDLGL